MGRPLRGWWWGLVGVIGLLVGSLPAMGHRGRTEPGRAAQRPPLAVEVRYGDSLWTLAREHGDQGRDVREVVAAMMRANEVDPGELQPGMVLVIPVDCLPERE